MEKKSFEPDFDAAPIDFADGRTEYFIGVETSFSARRSILVDDHRGNVWVATSIFPDMGRRTLPEIVATPDPRELAAVVRGALLLGCVDDPTSFGQVTTDGPIRAIRSYPEEGVVVMATSCTVLCLDRNGIRWRSHRLALGGISLGAASKNLLHMVTDDESSHQIDLFITNGEVAHSTFPLPAGFLTS